MTTPGGTQGVGPLYAYIHACAESPMQATVQAHAIRLTPPRRAGLGSAASRPGTLPIVADGLRQRNGQLAPPPLRRLPDGEHVLARPPHPQAPAGQLRRVARALRRDGAEVLRAVELQRRLADRV